MKIKLKTTHYNLEDLIDYLSEGIDIDNYKDDSFELNIENDELFDIVVEKIALFLSGTKYMESMEKYLSKKVKKEDVLNDLLEQHSEMLLENPYYPYITKVVLKNYLKDNDEIHIDAFLRFNMNKIDEEARYISAIDLENYSDNPKATTRKEKPIENQRREVQHREVNIIDRLIMIHDERYENNLFKDIHIRYLDDKLVFQNERKENLTLDYVFETLQVQLTIENKEGKNNISSDIFFLNVLTIVYKANRIIIHNDIPEQMQKEIESSLIRLLEDGVQFKIYFANGAKPKL